MIYFTAHCQSIRSPSMLYTPLLLLPERERIEAYILSLMLPVEISNTHVPDVSTQVVPFVTMK